MPDVCPWPVFVGGTCRPRMLHPDKFACSRCADVPPADIPRPPAESAKRADWVKWAVRCGADPEFAAQLGRSELIAQFSSVIPTDEDTSTPEGEP